ncbi:hypothetical protein M9H77_34570 [Catharanthus roseus]|uniref:Uncharacterized protein n=1 Tax=Catharanthus roseus TaxID=4058 RepID=A0ACB9ZQ58_CATRO|nr:hypothetical protein M9H77_34570 [Catharanthus roseus]
MSLQTLPVVTEEASIIVEKSGMLLHVGDYIIFKPYGKFNFNFRIIIFDNLDIERRESVTVTSSSDDNGDDHNYGGIKKVQIKSMSEDLVEQKIKRAPSMEFEVFHGNVQNYITHSPNDKVATRIVKDVEELTQTWTSRIVPGIKDLDEF